MSALDLRGRGGQQSTVDWQRRAGDAVGCRRAEKDGGASDVFRRAHTLQRDAVAQGIGYRTRSRRRGIEDVVGVHMSREDGVAADAALALAGMA